MRSRIFNWSNPLTELRQEMNRFLGQFTPGTSPGWMGQYPPVNIWDDEKTVYVEAELPGLKQDDLQLSVHKNNLTLAGERAVNAEEGSLFHRRERGVGKFSRIVELPVEVNANEVEAELKDGVLVVKLPKAESALPRKIQVQVKS